MSGSGRANLLLAYAASGVSFAATLLAGRILGAEEYGWVVLGASAGIFGYHLVNLGSDRALVRDAAHLPRIQDRNLLMHRNLALRGASGMLLILVVWVGAALYARSLADAVALGCFASWAMVPGLYPSAWFDLTGDIARHNGILLAEALTGLLIVGALALMPAAVRQAHVLGPLLLGTRLLSLVVQQRTWWRRARPFRFHWAWCCRRAPGSGVSLPITVAYLANALLTYGNQILLASRGNRGELAACGMALQVMNVVMLFQAQGIRFMSRSVAETCLTRDRVSGSLLRRGVQLAAASVPLALLAGLLLWFLPFLLHDPAYGAMRALITPLCIWVILVGFGQVTTLHMAACRLDRVYVAVAVAVGIISISIGSRLVPRYGAPAVAWLLLLIHGLSMSVMAGVMFFYARPVRARA